MFWMMRKLLPLALAFGAGIWAERQMAADACLDRGGALRAGMCVGATP